MRKSFVMIVIAVCAVGCGSSAEAEGTGSTEPAAATAPSAPAAPTPPAQPAHCDTIATLSRCREYRPIAVEFAGADSLRGLCEAGQGTFAMGACPTAGLVGTCDTQEHLERYYSSGGMAMTADSAREACANGLSPGSFVAP